MIWMQKNKVLYFKPNKNLLMFCIYHYFLNFLVSFKPTEESKDLDKELSGEWAYEIISNKMTWSNDGKTISFVR
jgi:hypothetical protein